MASEAKDTARTLRDIFDGIVRGRLHVCELEDVRAVVDFYRTMPPGTSADIGTTTKLGTTLANTLKRFCEASRDAVQRAEEAEAQIDNDPLWRIYGKLCEILGGTPVDIPPKEMIDGFTALRARAEAAEQRAADIETRTAVKLGEFAKLTDIIDAECKRLGIDWHGSASTTLRAVIEAAGVKPGDVCYRPTGETRPPKNGEWYQFRNSETIDNAVSDWNDVVENHRKIYRRLESPANQIADAEKMVEPSPAPAEEPERGSLRSELERLAGSLESGDCTRKWASKFLWTIIEDLDGIYSTSPTTIREQAEEIERLNSKIEAYHADRESLRSQLQQATEQGDLPIENDAWRKQAIREMREDILSAAPKPEAKGASVKNSAANPGAPFPRCEPSPSLPAGDGEAEPADFGFRLVTSDRNDPYSRYAITYDGNVLDYTQATDAMSWLNRRTAVEAQLAKYKRDAEAWEKDHRAMEAMERHSMSVVQCYPDWRACVMGRDHEGVIRASHLDAVLSLAAQLEQKGEGK